MAQVVQSKRAAEKRLLLFAIAVSLLLHAVIATVFLGVNIVTPPQSLPDVVQIRLFPSNPLQPELTEVVAETAQEPVEAVEQEYAAVTEVEIEELAVIEETEPTTLQRLEEPAPEPAESSVAEVIPQQQPVESQSAEVYLPSVLSVQETIQRVDDEDRRTSRLWAYDCNPIEEESELLTCKPTDRRNYRTLETNSTYQALNPVREFTRTQRALPVMTQNAPALAARLKTSDIPSELSDYLMQEVEAGITHLSDPGNRATRHIIQMTDKSEAAAMARQILDDPWVQGRAKALQQRKVHIQ